MTLVDGAIVRPGVATPSRLPTRRRRLPVAPGITARRLPKWGPAWPLTALLLGYPIWWVLGLAQFVFLIVAVPMAVQLARRRPIRLPRGFALWALFLVWVLISAVALGWTAPGTLQADSTEKLLGYAVRLLDYLAQTVVLLYVGNLTEKELPRLRAVRLLGFLFIVTVAGGLLGVIAPHFSFTSPFEAILPHTLRTNAYVVQLVRPASSQVQAVLGYSSGRPMAPFSYTNEWGGNLAVLLVFFLLGWWVWGSRRRRVAAVLICLVAIVPAVFSLNRGLWIALGVSVLYVAIRLAMRGRLTALGALVLLGAVVTALLFTTPLRSVITDRLHHGQSNTIRTDLSVDAYRGALSSPLVGYGSTRETIGGTGSIAVGRTAACGQCGNTPVGSNGQFWLTLFAQGFPGVALYTLFFLVVFWRSWRDRSPLGMAGTLVIGLSFMFNMVYSGVGSTLELYMIVTALLWRNEQAKDLDLPGSPSRPHEVPA